MTTFPSTIRRARQVLLLVAVTAIAGCERTPSGSGEVEVASVAVSPLTALLEEDSTHQFQATIRDARGNPLDDRDLLWSSSDEAVARVSADGMVTALSSGVVRIFATAECKAGSADVTVRPRPVASVRVSPPTAQIRTRTSIQLQAAAYDARGRSLDGRELRWESSDASVATVEPDGHVTARAPVAASIIAISEGQRDSATITVRPGNPALLVEVGGDGQEGRVGSTLADPLALRVTDADGHPIAGIAITWLAADGGSVSPPISETDASGTARAQWTLGPNAGAQSVTASGAGLSTTFAAAAQAGPAAALALHGGDG